MKAHQHLFHLLIVIATVVAAATASSAQAPDAPEERFRAMEARIRALEAEVQALRAAQTTHTAPTGVTSTASAVAADQSAKPGETAPTVSGGTSSPAAGSSLSAPGGQGTAGQLPVYGGASIGSKILNPDIGMIGNLVGAIGRNTVSPLPSLRLQEAELSLQAIVDPYARADFFLAIGENDIEVEEGYITFPAIPGGFMLRAGKMRAAFGRTNTFHNHTLPWIDRPLVAFNLMGGSLADPDVGIKDAGLSLTRILPPLKGTFFEVTGEVFRGDSGTLFQAHRRDDVATVGHLKSYRDLSESTNLEIGGSFARGHNDLGSQFITQLYGMDATLRWKPLRRAIYRSFAARTELVWSRREQVANTQRAFGMFASLEYQLARRWFGGLRYDWTNRAANAAQHDSAGSIVLTYWPSEFSQVRAQLRRTNYAERTTANELLFQFLFTLGAHGAHPF